MGRRPRYLALMAVPKSSLATRATSSKPPKRKIEEPESDESGPSDKHSRGHQSQQRPTKKAKARASTTTKKKTSSAPVLEESDGEHLTEDEIIAKRPQGSALKAEQGILTAVRLSI